MTAHHESLSSEAYQAEAERTRRRLSDNLDELNDRLTPGRLLDEALVYSRGGSGALVKTFAAAMRDSPIPSLLIGAGCVMYAADRMGLRDGRGRGDGQPSDLGRRAGETASAAKAGAAFASGAASAMTQRGADAASEQAAGLGDGARRAAAAVGDNAAAMAETARHSARALGDQAAAAAARAREGVGAVQETAQTYAAAAGDRIAEAADSTRRQALAAADQAKRAATTFINEQPLLCAALGVAIGASLAALLPSTEREDRLFGERSDALKAAAGDSAAGAVERAKDLAAQAPNPAAAKEAVREAGERVKDAAVAGAAAGARDARGDGAG